MTKSKVSEIPNLIHENVDVRDLMSGSVYSSNYADLMSIKNRSIELFSDSLWNGKNDKCPLFKLTDFFKCFIKINSASCSWLFGYIYTT